MSVDQSSTARAARSRMRSLISRRQDRMGRRSPLEATGDTDDSSPVAELGDVEVEAATEIVEPHGDRVIHREPTE